MSSTRRDVDPNTVRMAEQTALKDEVYYWLDNIRFLVEGVLFRVPRLPFILGSRSFTKKHGLLSTGNGVEPIIHLQSVSASQFRIFLKFLFPLPSNQPIEAIFTKEEWIAILSLCTMWHFPEFRKLAIQNLEGKLAELELIHVGRTLCIPAFVQEGYRTIVHRPTAMIITKEEAIAIGHETVNKLWIIRYQLQVAGIALDEGAVGRELNESFAEELAELREYDERGRVEEIGKEWVGMIRGDEKEAGEPAQPSVVQGAQLGGEPAVVTKLPSSVGSPVWSADPLGTPGDPPTVDHPNGWGMPSAALDEARWGEGSGEQQEDPQVTGQSGLAKVLRDLEGEEQEIVKEMQEVESRRLTLDATEKLEAVMKEKEDRIASELKAIEEAKRDEDEAVRDLEAADDSSAHDLAAQLQSTRIRRAELEQEHARNEGKEHGQIVRWNKVGKRHREKALVRLNAELLECQRKQKEVKECLCQLSQPNVDTAKGPGANEGVDARHIERSERDAESLRVIGGEEIRVRWKEQAQLQRKAELKEQEEKYAGKLANDERLLSQPGSSLPRTIQRVQRRVVASTTKLQKIRAELAEVSQLLDSTRQEYARFEDEKWVL